MHTQDTATGAPAPAANGAQGPLAELFALAIAAFRSLTASGLLDPSDGEQLRETDPQVQSAASSADAAQDTADHGTGNAGNHGGAGNLSVTDQGDGGSAGAASEQPAEHPDGCAEIANPGDGSAGVVGGRAENGRVVGQIGGGESHTLAGVGSLQASAAPTDLAIRAALETAIKLLDDAEHSAAGDALSSLGLMLFGALWTTPATFDPQIPAAASAPADLANVAAATSDAPAAVVDPSPPVDPQSVNPHAR